MDIDPKSFRKQQYTQDKKIQNETHESEKWEREIYLRKKEQNNTFDDDQIQARAKRNLRKLYQEVKNQQRNLSPYNSDILTIKRKSEKKQNINEIKKILK